jgi:hypothetical protein
VEYFYSCRFLFEIPQSDPYHWRVEKISEIRFCTVFKILIYLNLLTCQKPPRLYAWDNQEYLGSINCIFTMMCSAECFVRVRSGQSLDHSVVKDRLNMHSVGECELACLRSRYFTCRVFSYRYWCAYMRFKITAWNIKFMVLWFVTTCSAGTEIQSVTCYKTTINSWTSFQQVIMFPIFECVWILSGIL